MSLSRSTAAAELAAVLRHVPTIVWTTDRDLRFTSARGSLFERLGADVVGQRLDEIEGAPAEAVAAHRVALDGEVVEYSYEFAGNTWTVTVEPLPDADGAIVGCLAVALDTTAPRRREHDLRAAQERLSALAENVPLTVYTATLDRNPRPRYISGRVEELLGVPAHAFTFDHLRAAVHPDDRERVIAAMDRADREGLPLKIEYRIVDRQGRTRWVEDSSEIVTIAGERLAQGYLLDIGDRKATEDVLHQRVTTRRRVAEVGRRALEGASIHALVREALSVLDGGLDAIAGAYFERDGAELVIRESYGWAVRGSVAYEGSPSAVAAERGRTFVAADLDDYLGPPIVHEGVLIRSSIAVPVVVGSSVHGVLAVHAGRAHAFGSDDVSLVEQLAHLLAATVARDQAAEAQREVERELVHSQRLEAVGQLAAGVAHDFNNLLTAISGYTELARAASDGRAAVYLGQVLEASQRAGELTAQLLAFSRKQLLAPKHIETRELVEGVLPILRPLLRERIELEVEIAPDSPAVFVDPARLENALLNLAVNARDAMPEGGALRIATGRLVLDERAAAEHGVLPGEYATLRLSDTGTGMSRDVLEKVFEPFFTTKKLGEGTGLGLSSVYGSVRQSGGFVTVSSELGRGSEFLVALPASEGSPPAAIEAPAPPAGPVSASVLVVEDDPAVRDVVVSWLTEIGYRTNAASSAEHALAELANDRYDLVLSDAVLGGLSGVELTSRVRRIAPDTRCLLMSGYARDLVLADADDPEAPPVLQKPFSLAALAAAVEERLTAARSAAA
ncbi:MAG TPA: response regulator [Gaiellaceae bacterium]|nr:response regulator [Gaiellaceae bacterium]